MRNRTLVSALPSPLVQGRDPGMRQLDTSPHTLRRARALVIGVGGGASVLTTDACDRRGLRVTEVRSDVQAALRARAPELRKQSLELTGARLKAAGAAH